MDNRNVFVAIALSLAVLLFWGAFFETPKPIGTNDNFNVSKTQNKKWIIRMFLWQLLCQWQFFYFGELFLKHQDK